MKVVFCVAPRSSARLHRSLWWPQQPHHKSDVSCTGELLSASCLKVLADSFVVVKMSSHATLALLQPHSNSHSVQRWSLMLKTSLRAAWRLGVGWMCPAITYHGVVRPPTLGPMFKLTASGNKYFSNNVISIINNCMKFFMTYDCTSPYCYVLHASPWCSVPSHESVRSVSKQIFNRYNLWKSSLLEQWNVFLMKKKKSLK